MHNYVHPPKESDEGDFEDPQQQIDLGYSAEVAKSLWVAYEQHGIMPRTGGYLDQPLRWQRLVWLMNRRHNRVPRDDEGEDEYPTPPSDAATSMDDL